MRELFRLPIGYPVLVCTQAMIDKDFHVFIGMPLRVEDSYSTGIYKGRISVVYSYYGFGQNESLEIIHNIPNIKDRVSMAAWCYFYEYEEMQKHVKGNSEDRLLFELKECLNSVQITQ